MNKKIKVAHDIRDFDEGEQVILTLKDHQLIKGQDLNEDIEELQNIQMREKGQNQFNRYLKDNISKLAHAQTSHIQHKMDGQAGNKLLPHYDEIKYNKEGFVIEQDDADNFKTPKGVVESIKQQKEAESLMLKQNKLASEYEESERRVIKPRKVDKSKSTKDLLNFLENTAEDQEDDREKTKRAAEYLLDELDIVKKKRNFDKAIQKAMISNKETQERIKAMQDYELQMALRRKKKAAPVDQVSKLLQQTYDKAPDANATNTVEMDLDPLKVAETSTAPPKIQMSKDLKMGDARGGMTSVLNVYLPSQRLFNKEQDKGEDDLPERFEDIPEEQLEKMKQELAFMHQDNIGIGLSGALKFIREKGLNNREEYEGRSKDEVPKGEREQGQDRIKLEYRDAKGKLMTPKQAFRYMCWIFHGEGPGKNKIEKRKMRQLINQKIKTIQPGESVMMRMLRQHQKKSDQAHMVFKQQK